MIINGFARQQWRAWIETSKYRRWALAFARFARQQWRAWIETDVVGAIFDKLAVRYGAAWLRQWDGVDMVLVRADWEDELSGFALNWEPLRYALRNLPERCPTVGEFRAIANRCPPPQFERLPAPAADPSVVTQATAQLEQVAKAMTAQPKDQKAWARRILARVAAGDTSVSRYARESAEVALGQRAGMSA